MAKIKSASWADLCTLYPDEEADRPGPDTDAHNVPPAHSLQLHPKTLLEIVGAQKLQTAAKALKSQKGGLNPQLFSKLKPFTTTRWDGTVYNVNSLTTSAQTANVYTFALNKLVGYVDFTAAFRFYRIRKVTIYWMPGLNTGSHPNTAVNNPGVCFHLIDTQPIDSGVPSISSILACQSTVAHWGGKMFTINITPRVDVAVYQSSTSTGYAPSTGVWIETSDSAVPHYGMKVITQLQSLAPPTSSNDLGSFLMKYTIDLAVVV
jgi:hypothetical protein